MPVPGLFDVHAHLTHPEMAPRLGEVMASAREAGVTTIVSNGLNPSDNEAVQALARRYDGSDGGPVVRPAFGFYPVDTVLVAMEAMGVPYPRDAPPVSADEGVAWVRDHVGESFAVGEIGLDGYWVPEALWEAQEQVFRRLVALALEADKPIVIHTRKRERRALEILLEMGATRVDWHCFGGRVKLAREIAERGHWLSIPANARRNEAFTRMLETLPRDKVLLETDCPYLGPEAGVRSEPAHVRGTASFAAERWGCTEDEVRARMSDNFAALFGVAP
jgi:TatD DNase family protein